MTQPVLQRPVPRPVNRPVERALAPERRAVNTRIYLKLPPQLDDPSAELTPQLIVEVIRDVAFHYFPQLADGTG